MSLVGFSRHVLGCFSTWNLCVYILHGVLIKPKQECSGPIAKGPDSAPKLSKATYGVLNCPAVI